MGNRVKHNGYLIKPMDALQQHHTFAISAFCEKLITIHSIEQLISVYQKSNKPRYIMGSGSNTLFTATFQGEVLLNRIKGITHSESNSSHHLHICAGEDWPSVVSWAVNKGIGGLENLALIPGCAGSAPIQNIGAYGVELKDVCVYVDYLDLDTLEVIRLSSIECEFAYRDSVFKHRLYKKAVIVAIGLKLPKHWRANVSYGPLSSLRDKTHLVPKDVFDLVVSIRQDKLPDPNITGNAGSFFKNPIISQQAFKQLQEKHPEVVAYPSGNDMKIAAGWLIEHAGLKGYQIGGAQIHPKQALVIVNSGDASADDVLDLAAHICRTVKEKYAITLEHEVRFLAEDKEVYLHQLRSLA